MSLLLPPLHVPADQGKPVFLVGDTYTTLISSNETNGELSLVEAVVPADAGPPPHTHHGESETFILMDGHLTIEAGDDQYEVEPGGVVYVPKGVRHSFRNSSGTKPARMYFLYTPGGMDGMFQEIGTPGLRGIVGPPLTEADVTAMAAVAGKYNYTFD
ncbi:cupin domain-containing protein [Actinacidiphila oryziradicis]|uniref:Cupin domain-containing protein n=1 Tax=Actinacidiphila oryziradicis TaxID=2571141 RepID=A0A4U0S064_9ACTN|nr:cupin domain-containing protein [Actinacidiphila oryziradicis]TKA02132.1 cupin domain-containing protein [Actinacidiphila oryziradicis]